MKHMASIFAALLTIASIATARSAFGADIATVVSNATDVTVTSDTLVPGEALYVYTETGTEFNFTLANQSKAWILVVGGGGAGGAGATATVQGTKGSGGGGGGGGMIEQNGISLAPGKYTIAVGAGGAAVSSGNGGDGSPSSIVSSGFQRIAKGGGGGAAAGAGAGNPGGSGGGSSYDAGGDSIAGGAAEDGQGNAGGEGSAAGGGAGGGGAGGIGGSVTSSTSGYGGKGGAGKESAITGATVTYAPGGGGGANTNGQQGLGGLGDNSGKGGARNTANRATAGTDGIGGGGGGGSVDNSRKSAKGGSGIVIIRVTKIYGEITPPVAKDFEYTGSSQNIWPEYDPSDCDLSVAPESLRQTAVGTYTFTATPKDGSCWKGTGGSTDPTNITWHIVKASNSLTLVQDGWVEGSPVAPVVSYKVTDDPSEPTFEYSTAEDSGYTTTLPTTPSNYWIKASIAETDNYYGATAGPVQFKILGATESPNANLGFYVPITFPGYIGSGTALIRFTLPPSFQYKTEDNETSSLCVCSANGQVYPQTVEWSDNGAATITVEIDNMSATKQVFLCWGLVEGGTVPTLDAPSSSTALSLAPTVGDIVRDTSKTLQNYIKDLAMPSWRVGETPSTPEYKYKIGIPTFRYVGTGGYDSSEKPTEPDSYTLMVTIPEETGTDNYGPYSGVAAQTVTFRILGETETPLKDKELKYFSTVTASSAVEAGKVSFTVPTTHDWVATYNDGTDVRFCDIDGNLFKSSFDSWLGDGSARFFVEVPAMAVGDKFYMCWGETVDKFAPEVDAPSGSSISKSFTFGDTVIDTSLKLKNWIKDLKMSGFRLGDSPTVPTCTRKIGDVIYQYSKYQSFPSGQTMIYDTANPPAAGTYYMRAVVAPSTENGYEGAVSENIPVTCKFHVLGANDSPLDALAWFAPVTATGTLDSPASVTVKLPNTFDYRTIYNDGSDIRFSDADGNVLPSAAATAWATNGTAEFKVQLPEFSSSYKFYVCWGPVVGKTIPDNTSTPVTTMGSATTSVGDAVRDVDRQPLVNHWVVNPWFPSAWATNDTPTFTAGDPAYGDFKLLCRNVATGEETVGAALPTTAGDFELVAYVDAGDYWAGMTNDPFEVSVSKHDSSISLTREHGAEGRVLLMNADVTPGAEIYNQGYADKDPSYSTFWEHSNTDVPPNSIKNNFNVSNEVDSTLWATNKKARLWTLFNCRQGNVFRKDDSYDLSKAKNYNYLPWDSTTARDIGEHESESHTRHGAGQIIMRNSTSATVYSSCFTNGIGTIYFDAVNHHVISSEFGVENYTLKVWIATDCITSLDEVVDVVPTDEYVHEFDEAEPEPGVIVTNANWRAVEAVAIRIENGAMGAATTNETITLDVADGKTDNNFYRVFVPLDIRDPVRFKIERASRNEAETTEALDNYILLDNIIASYPAMRASITTYGDYDPTRQGRAVLGQRMALTEAFPSPSSDGLLGRGKVSFVTNEGVENPDTDAFIVSARFNYRWRYLNQSFYHDGKFSTSDDGEFASVRLSPTLDYASTRPLDLPGLPGDIEYWYELVLGAPYYEYVDYSGLGLSDAMTSVHCEEVLSYVGSRDGAGDATLPSGGTNWFVRIREGASPYEKVVLTIDETTGGSDKSEDIAMDLIGDHQWRGFVVVTNKTERDISFSVKAMNRQTDGATEFDEGESNVDVFLSRTAEPVDISERPYSGVLVKYGEEPGFYAKLHYLTNVASYVEFQFNDETRAISISHADWQDFNSWFSSRRDDADKFYSSAHETNSTTVAVKRYPARQTDGSTTNVVSQFNETPLTANAWHEEFKLTGTQQLTPDGYWMNKTFASARTPKGWLAEHGLWVAQAWGMTNSTDFAVQLEGRGNGSVQFIDKSPTPGGLDTVSFNARLAQFSEFSDISWSWKSIMSKNYTIAALGCFDESPKFDGFSGEASVSLIAGYVPGVGCYEYRITIYNVDAEEGTDPNVKKNKYATCRHAIYKWTVSGNSYVATPLVDFLGTSGEENSWWWNAENKNRTEIVKRLPLGKDGTSYSGMYMSFSNEVNKVIITAGVSAGYEGEGTTTQKSNKSSGGGAFTFDSEKKFLQIGCTDTSPIAKFGTFGALSRNCPARILYPRVYTNNTVAIPGSGTNSISGGVRWKGPVALLASTAGAELQRSNFDNWAHQPGRMEAFHGSLSTQPWGIQAVTNISQTVRIQTLPVGSEDEWTDLDAFPVNSFSFGKPYVKSLRSSVPCWVRFANGGNAADTVRTDVVIDNIKLTQWCGQDGSVTNASSANGYYYDFYHTAAWISNKVEKVGINKAETNRVALLAPRRSPSGTHPVGIRTPYLHGLGAIFFNYCDCGEDAELALECWKGNYTDLNRRSAEAEGSDGWQNLTNWTFTAGDSGTKSFYFGERAPSNGVFRIVIPQKNVKKAWTNDTYDVNWGAVTITDIWCFDEPEFDAHSWWGWNFLTTGWSDGKGNGYAAIEDSGDGSSGVLNNTLDVDTLVTGDQSDYAGNSPFIQSPTLSGRNIGEVSFRAKRDPNYSSGCVTVWGAKKGDYQSGESWTAVTNIVVDSPFFERFTVKCAEEEQFAAIRLGIAGVVGIDERFAMKAAKAAEYPSPLPRVVLDEIVIRERVKPEVGFRLDYARPFRLGLSESTAVLNIASRDQQPLLGEQFGFQAEVEVTGLADEVDLGHAPEVYLSFYPSSEPWGYANWKDAPGAVTNILLAAADDTNLVYRSTASVPLSLAGPYDAEDALGYRIVQYHFTVKYWDKGGDSHETPISESQWEMPSWYFGFDDPNKVEGAKFSPFTLLDTVSPGRAWFNEINFSDENTSNAKQFIELTFPAGYDMTGWRIYRYDAWGDNPVFMGALGLTGGIPSTKDASGGDPNFAFLALTSANKAHPDADANWSSGSGVLSASDCYGFQLIRPSGVIEHQVVVQGRISETGRYSKEKTGTNVVATLERLVGGEWDFVGVDTNAAIKSTGVFQNAGADPEDWNDIMDMTPGRINANQVIPSDWFLPPGGTNVWLTLSTSGNLVWIVDGDERIAAKTVVVPQDVETNIVFATAPWHALSSLLRDTTNEVASAAVRSAGTGGTNMWTYAFKESAKNSATLVASAGPDPDVLLRGNLDPADPYTPAVMNWLLGGMANGEPFAGTEISTNSFFRGLSANGPREYLPLKDRYWLDMDPTVDCDLYGGMGGPENLDKPVPTPPVVAEVHRSPDVTGIWPVKVTNRVVTVSMFISNKVSNAVRAPNRLQGLGGEKSDIVGARNWTSETFKITMSLIKPVGAPGIDVRSNYWPMAAFVFGPGSFSPPDSDHPFAARIEVLDPMSPSSPAYGYGWGEYPGSSYGYRWDLSHGMYYRDPSMLQSTNTWSKTWEVTNDY